MTPDTAREPTTYKLDNNMTSAPERGPTRQQRRRQLAMFKATKKFDAAELAYLKRAMKGLHA